MPYIKPEDRVAIDKVIEHLHFFTRRNPGHLNYAVTKLLHNQLEDQGMSYSELNMIIGTLECVKLELYRTVLAPYEDEKKCQNGSVSELDEGNLYEGE